MTSEVRSEIGAANNRLEATADNLTNIFKHSEIAIIC